VSVVLKAQDLGAACPGLTPPDVYVIRLTSRGAGKDQAVLQQLATSSPLSVPDVLTYLPWQQQQAAAAAGTAK